MDRRCYGTRDRETYMGVCRLPPGAYARVAAAVDAAVFNMDGDVGRGGTLTALDLAVYNDHAEAAAFLRDESCNTGGSSSRSCGDKRQPDQMLVQTAT